MLDTRFNPRNIPCEAPVVYQGKELAASSSRAPFLRSLKGPVWHLRRQLNVAFIPTRAPSHPRTACDGIRGGRLESRAAAQESTRCTSTQAVDISTRAPRTVTPSASSRRRWRAPLASEPSARTTRCQGNVRVVASREHHAGEPRRPRGEVAVGRHQPGRDRANPPQHLAAPNGARHGRRRTHTSATAKPIWPNARAVPKFAAPSAAASASPRRRPPTSPRGPARSAGGATHHPQVTMRRLAYRHHAHRLPRPPARR